MPSCQGIWRVWEEYGVIFVFQATSLLIPHILSAAAMSWRQHAGDPVIQFCISGVEHIFGAMWVQRRLQWLAKTWERFVHGWSICKHKIEYLKNGLWKKREGSTHWQPICGLVLDWCFSCSCFAWIWAQCCQIFSFFFPQEKPESCVVNVKAFDFLILTTKQTVCRPNKAQWCTRFSQSTARWRLWVQKFSGAKNPNALAGTS